MDITLVFEYILGFVVCSECIAGGIINLIIVVANLIKWKTMKSLQIGDKILSSLATSRSLFFFFFFLFYLSFLLDLLDDFLIWSILVGFMKFLHTTNLWFTTVLCVFYCVKITSYNWKFFIFLKTKISTLVPRFLLSSLLISVMSSLPFGCCNDNIDMQNLRNVSMVNVTLSKVVIHENPLTMLLLSLIISCPPFVIFLVADCLLLHSLWMHTRRMRSSGSGFRSPNLETHFSAVKSMSFFLLLQIIYFCVAVYSTLMNPSVYGAVSMLITLIVMCCPPSLHSLYMIFSNSEVKKTCIPLFHRLICRVQG